MIINFQNIEKINGADVLVFYKNGDEVAYMTKDDDKIHFKHKGHYDLVPKSQLREFIFDRINDYTKKVFSINLISKSDRSISYLEIWVVRYKIPVIIYLAFVHGIKKALEMFNVNYTLDNKRDPAAYFSVPVILNNKKQILNLYAKNTVQELFINGLKKVKINGIKLSGLDDKKSFEELIEKSFGSKAISDLELFEEKIIDPVTAEWLKSQNYPTKFSELIATTMTRILMNGKVQNPADPKNGRLRLAEAILDIVYAQLMQAARAVMEGTKKKLSLDPNYIVNQLQKSGLIHYTKSLSPLDEMSQSRKITKSGVGNMKADIIPLEMRDVVPESAIGVMSPTHSHEYTKIGIVHGMTLSANIKNDYGEVHPEESPKVTEAHKVLSASELMTSPFINLNDPTRNVMGAQQSSQFLEIQNPDIPLSQTGYESLAPHLVSDRFSKKAPCDGKIVEIVPDKYIVVECSDSKEKKMINIQPVRARTKRGVYMDKNYIIKVKPGQKVEKDDILAVTSSLQHGLLTPGKNVVVAITNYGGQNFEDGFVVTQNVLNSYEYNTLEKITIIVNPGDKIEQLFDKIGSATEPGQPLVKIKVDNHFDNLIEKLEASENNINSDEKDDSSVFKGMKYIKKGEVEYLSPGGVVSDIVVKINDAKGLDNKLLVLYKTLVKHLKQIQNECKKHFPEGSSDYIECANSHENSAMLKIGDHKINGVEFPGAVIEYYVRVPQKGSQSSKIVLGATGAKGTVQYVIPKGLEPVAEDTKLNIDVVVSSLSIFARRSIAVLALMYSGKITWWINKRAQELAKAGKMNEVYKLLKEFYTLQDKTDDNSLVAQFEADWDPVKAKKELVRRDPMKEPYYPMIITPFKNQLNINDLEKIAKWAGVPLEEKVYFPEFDIETDKPVAVGIMPLLMLEHLPESMSNAVSISKKSALTGQGISGQKEQQGALGVGQYDVASILSSSEGTAPLVKELSALRSDDKVAEKTLVSKIIKTGEMPSIDEIPNESSKTKKLSRLFLLAAGIRP